MFIASDSGAWDFAEITVKISGGKVSNRLAAAESRASGFDSSHLFELTQVYHNLGRRDASSNSETHGSFRLVATPRAPLKAGGYSAVYFGAARWTWRTEICSASARPVGTPSWSTARDLSHRHRYAVAETPGNARDVADRFLPRDIWLLCRMAGKFVRGNMGSGKLNVTDRRWTSSREQASRGSNRNCLKECCRGADRRSDTDFLGASDVSGKKIRRMT